MSFIGWKNYVNAFRKDQDYSKALVAMIENTVLRTPLILIFSISLIRNSREEHSQDQYSSSLLSSLQVLLSTSSTVT